MDNSLCLDTSVLIAYLKDRQPGASAVRRAIQERVCYITTISVYELLFGLARSHKQIGEEDLLGLMSVAAFDEPAARRAANLHADLVQRNQDIGVKDVLIAAICLEKSLPLLTTNDRHFGRVPELQVLAPNALLAQ